MLEKLKKKKTLAPGSFAVSGVYITPKTIDDAHRFRMQIPIGAEILSAHACTKERIMVYYKYNVPAAPMIPFDILVLKDGEILQPKDRSHHYNIIESVALDGDIYHLFHHFKTSKIILPREIN